MGYIKKSYFCSHFKKYCIRYQRIKNHSNNGDYPLLCRVSDTGHYAEHPFCSTQSDAIFRNGIF